VDGQEVVRGPLPAEPKARGKGALCRRRGCVQGHAHERAGGHSLRAEAERFLEGRSAEGARSPVVCRPACMREEHCRCARSARLERDSLSRIGRVSCSKTDPRDFARIGRGK